MWFAQRLLPWLVTGLAMALAATACTPAAPAAAPHVTYPPPAPGAGPDSRLLPAPAPDPGGSALASARTLAGQVADGGRAGLAALLTALTKSGVTLLDTDGSVVSKGDNPISGVQVPVGEVIAAASQNTYDHGLTAGQMASAIAALTQDKGDVTALRQHILNELAAQGVAGQYLPALPKTAGFMSAFIIGLGLAARPPVDLRVPSQDDVKFTGLQTWLLWLSLASGEFDYAVAVTSHQKVSAASTDSFESGRTADGRKIVLVSSGPCTADGVGGNILDAFPNLLGPGVGGIPFTEWDGVASWISKSLGGESNPGVPSWMSADIRRRPASCSPWPIWPLRASASRRS